LLDEKALLENLKIQLEKHNHIQFSDSEFEKVLNISNKCSVFEKAKVYVKRSIILFVIIR
jgi:type I restriction enzyme R subunit